MPAVIASIQGHSKEKENKAPSGQGHSQGLSVFLAQLAGVFDTRNQASHLNA